ncbi:hypothetical protein SAMN04488107_1419 [Geodermatophilus saharensis]|uniref:Uncharacterized protein n=1 Tax=Geodermatophilus saharensis TaxID=1137994 RepID=A0A239BUL8_9ACTN|nr:hypothetical protein [Geodermatophilus saharensis]SNS11111.1 hypothetical protein SAMN04488107_1419 [Geodermatophilus saharensis]
MTRAPLHGGDGSRQVGAASARRLAPVTAVLAVAVAAVAVLGPLPDRRLEGADVVALVAVAPLTLLAAAMVRRCSPAGPLLALGTSLGAGYLAAERVPGRAGVPGADGVHLPVSVAVLVLCAAVAVGSWRAVPQATAVFDRPSRRLIGVLLLAAGTSVAGRDPALLLPAAATGVGLLRGARWAGPAAFAVSGCLALVAAEASATTWTAPLPGAAGPAAGALTATVLGAVGASPAVLCWTAVVRTRRQAWAAPVPRREAAVAIPVPRGAGTGATRVPAPRRAGDRP